MAIHFISVSEAWNIQTSVVVFGPLLSDVGILEMASLEAVAKHFLRDVRGSLRHTKITILPQFWTSDQHESCFDDVQTLHFTTVWDVRRVETMSCADPFKICS